LSHADAERIALQAVKATVLANQKTISPQALQESIESQKKRVALTREMTDFSPHNQTHAASTDNDSSCIADGEESCNV